MQKSIFIKLNRLEQNFYIWGLQVPITNHHIKDVRFNINRHLISITMDNNVFKCHIFQAIKDIRKQNRRPDINAIFKNIASANTTNIRVEDVKQQVDLLIASAKFKNMTTSQGLESFDIIGSSITFQASLTLEC